MTRRDFIKTAAACAALPLVPTAMASVPMTCPCGPFVVDLAAVDACLAEIRNALLIPRELVDDVYGESRLAATHAAWFEHRQAMKFIRKTEGITDAR